MRHKRLACFVKRGQHILDANALMDGPWFVGDQYLHVQAWEADFHLHIAKISTTTVWLWHKLGKLLKVDDITSTAIRGRYARLCVQINTATPLPKRVKIGAFWQDIVYENLPLLCYRCGRIGHRELHCSETSTNPHTEPPQGNIVRGDQGTPGRD